MSAQLNWSEVINEYHEELYRFCLRMLRSEAEAEEALQDAFEKMWRKRRLLKSSDKVRAWMYQVTRNTCLDRLRKRKRSPDFVVDTETLAVSCDPQLRIKLESLIAELPQRQREVFLLRHLHGFSTAETAKILKVRSGTVKSHLKRATDSLRKVLAPEINECLEKTTKGNGLSSTEY